MKILVEFTVEEAPTPEEAVKAFAKALRSFFEQDDVFVTQIYLPKVDKVDQS